MTLICICTIRRSDNSNFVALFADTHRHTTALIWPINMKNHEISPNNLFLPARRIRKRDLCHGNVAWWLVGSVSDTRRYCIKTAKPILKLFRPPGSHIILVFCPLAAGADTQFQGNPSAGALNSRGRKNWRFSTENAIYLGNGAV